MTAQYPKSDIIPAIDRFKAVTDCKFGNFATFSEFLSEFHTKVEAFNRVRGGLKIDGDLKTFIFAACLGPVFKPLIDHLADVREIAGFGEGASMSFSELAYRASCHWDILKDTNGAELLPYDRLYAAFQKATEQPRDAHTKAVEEAWSMGRPMPSTVPLQRPMPQPQRPSNKRAASESSSPRPPKARVASENDPFSPKFRKFAPSLTYNRDE